MACKGCGKNRQANPTTQLECPVCGTLLHGRIGTMPKVGNTLICGVCNKKYQKLKELEKEEPKKVEKPKVKKN